MSVKPILSIILPIKNEGRNIVHLCESLSKQRYKHEFEIIIVDDSDREDSLKLVHECVSKLRASGIHVAYTRGENKGVGKAMVLGLRSTYAPWIFFLDADNALADDFMETVISVLYNTNSNNIAYISFYSGAQVGRLSLLSRGLFLANIYLSLFRKGLLYDRKLGFVNVLRIYSKKFLFKSIGINIHYPYLSYQDQPGFREKVRNAYGEGWNKIHINKVLVYDIRHLYEPYDLRFVCRRMEWYTKGIKDRNVGTIILTLLLPLALLILALSITNSYILLIALAIYVIIFTIMVIKHKIYNYIETIYSFLFMPLLLLVRSLCTYRALFKI